MIPKALRNFVYTAFKETENFNLAWHQADSGSYFCDHKENTLHISYYFDSDRGQSLYSFHIVINGKTTPFTVRDSEDEDFETMANFYEAVIANANTANDDLSNFF
jgi:hypothetical protein